jgi:hypothetical protein
MLLGTWLIGSSFAGGQDPPLTVMCCGCVSALTAAEIMSSTQKKDYWNLTNWNGLVKDRIHCSFLIDRFQKKLMKTTQNISRNSLSPDKGWNP